ncbi:SDR family NAD(P)-dependent oxidoreductase [Brucella gallinifaecis]|uniref:SDR family oxidoreductase n=1 Tax=Brucella gallinifaecis TaxID=215590 RepID=A0A502BJF8_9HYPH|nr:SDR family NAD(P)-dependent oxidoreductase [Brucella gallinifaecis]TPF74275.1 SDR family oxidoreductase [Brucella gallinifaecis]
MKIDLSGKRALIIGGGTFGEGNGIGRTVASTFAACGAQVIIADRDEEAANATAELVNMEGGKASIAVFDVADHNATQTALSAIDPQTIDVLYYNVGIGFASDTLSLDEAQFQTVLNVNLVGLHQASRAVLPGMRLRKSGVILASSSAWSHRHLGYSHAFYATSKAAMNHYIQMIAQENASFGIRANSISPGFIDTPRIRVNLAQSYDEKSFDQIIAKRSAQVPMKRLGEPQDVANIAAFLASSLASYVTGADFKVDGGISSAKIA